MDFGGSFTDRLFDRAGFQQGARALDIGCGTGDVTLRLARKLGAEGRVVGMDLNGSALDAARQRAAEECLENVTFIERDLQHLGQDEQPFDIITCRRVLMYLPDQVAAVKLIRAALRAGGLFVVQEHDATIMQSNETLPLYEQARSWIWDTVRAEGANIRTGFDLYGILVAAGFPDIDISAEAVVLTPAQAGHTAAIVDAMAERIVAAGVASLAEMDVETLEERLIEERRASSATTIGEMMFGAIARV